MITPNQINNFHKAVFGAVLALAMAAGAQAQIVTSGLVADYDASTLSSNDTSWSNSATGAGAWGSLTISSGVASVSTSTPSGYNAANLTAGNQLFKIDLGSGFYTTYTGMTVIIVTRFSNTQSFTQLAGTWDGNNLHTGSYNNQIGVGEVQVVANPGTGTNGSNYLSPAFATPYSNDVKNKWTILASTVTNNTSGTSNHLGLYETDYVDGTPSTSSWAQSGLSTDSTLTLQGGANSARFSVGGGLYWWGGVNTNLTSKSEIASVLVYNRVLDSSELAQTTSALYNQVLVVPEPSTSILLLMGAAGGILCLKRRHCS